MAVTGASRHDGRQRWLWIAPNLNHYKARFLDRLVATGEVEIV